jgi:CRISPR/Cas system endoribonuclease Cas6 (RAMP superfamily)
LAETTDYRYSRAAARSLLFSWLERQIPNRPRRRFERAWGLLGHRQRELLRQHKQGQLTLTDWREEEKAVDALAKALRVVDDAYKARREERSKAA